MNEPPLFVLCMHKCDLCWKMIMCVNCCSELVNSCKQTNTYIVHVACGHMGVCHGKLCKFDVCIISVIALDCADMVHAIVDAELRRIQSIHRRLSFRNIATVIWTWNWLGLPYLCLHMAVLLTRILGKIQAIVLFYLSLLCRC